MSQSLNNRNLLVVRNIPLYHFAKLAKSVIAILLCCQESSVFGISGCAELAAGVVNILHTPMTVHDAAVGGCGFPRVV